jgi:hypothetical protein
MIQGIGLGIGINRSNYAQGIFSAYQSRVVADGGVTEAGACVNAVSSLLQSASLLLIPSGYKSGKAYAEIPTNGNGDLTWTRASDAWRTNADGLIQRVPWNLLSNTNTFSSWSLEGGALTSGFADPEGGLTAYRYVQTTGGLYSGSSTATSGNKTASIWLRSVSGTSITCNLQDGGSGNNTVVTVTGDWQLFTATYTTSTSRPSLYVWGISNASGIFVWHPQLVEGSSAQTYFPTTDRLNVPRLSYMYGSCPALLLEPQRTNVFQNSGWTGGGATPTGWTSFISGSTTALASIKNLSVTAYRFSGTSQRTFFVNSISVTSGTTYTISFYVESVTTAAEIQQCVSFGSSTSSTYYKNGVAITSLTLVEAGNLYSVTWVAGTTATADMRIGIGTQSNVTANIVISMPQMEQGAYPTTFILSPVGASATRIADSFSRNNIYTNGLITSSGGTWFVELRNNVAYTRDGLSTGLFIDTDASSYVNGINIRNAGGGSTRLSISKWVSGSGSALYTTTTDTTKLAIKWNGSTADIFANGTKVVSATSFTPTAMQFLKSEMNQIPIFIQSMALYPSPLSDTDCTTLTTL